MTLVGGGGGEGWVGRGNPHTASILAVRLPSPIVSSNSWKKIANSYIYVRQERSSNETDDRAPRTLKRTRFCVKKRIKEKKKKEGKAVRTNWRLFFVALLLKIWKGTVFYA